MTKKQILARVREIMHLFEHEEIRQDNIQIGKLVEEIKKLADKYKELI